MAAAYDSNNIFAKILRGEIPAHKVSEDERSKNRGGSLGWRPAGSLGWGNELVDAAKKLEPLLAKEEKSA